LDRKRKGVDVPQLVKDLMNGQDVEAFVNTHPHNDHLCGTTELSKAVTISNVWHSGHKPGKDDESKYQELLDLIKKVKKAGGEEVILEGSRTSIPMGLAEYHVLAPAGYVTDDVNDETPERRRARIHEQCAVIKFGKSPNWTMIVGDANRCAFEDHITKYHNDRLPSLVLAASHHGSRTFFKEAEEDEPYNAALDKINPEYVIVSAPKKKDSPHDHPHDDAMKLYRDKCGDDNVLHMGEQLYCYYTDIYADGYSGVQDDQGQLVDRYGFADDDDDGGGKNESWKPAITAAPAVYARTRVDDRPMGDR
jgi:hypothetical protein